MLPRIPKVEAFREFARAGKLLADLHVGYETIDPFPLDDPSASTEFVGSLRVERMRYLRTTAGTVDRGRIAYNSDIILSGIPADAHRYMLGPRSAVEWVMERYQIKRDKPSGIVNDPNAWCEEVGNPRYVIDLLKRIVTVSIETMQIVDALPPLDVVE